MSYINRVEDSVADALITWTTDTPDTMGVYYPGPGVFGDDTEDYTCYLVPGGSGGGGTATIVVGSVASGDTLATCDYLDTGNGAGLQAALLAADNFSGGTEVRIRSNLFINLALPGAPSRISIPASVSVISTDVDVGEAQPRLRIQFRTTGDVDQLEVGGVLKGAMLYAPVPTAAMTYDSIPAYVISTGALRNVFMDCGGYDYDPGTAAWQPARQMVVIMGFADENVSVYSVPAIGALRDDMTYACRGIMVGGIF